MKKSLSFALFFLLFFSVFAQAQNNCGINRHLAIQNIQESKALAKKHLNGLPEDEKYIPIKFHLVADTDGQHRVTEQEVFQALCEVNQEFDDVGFTFYIKDGFSYIDNSSVNSYTPTSTTAQNFCKAVYDSSAINIFIVQKIVSQGIVTPLVITDYTNDWIVVEDRFSLDKLYVSHGLGHFFSLLNTYSSDNSWAPGNNATINMEIDTSSACAQNCDTAGDLICDTPPDYFEPLQFNNCTYTGSAKDYCGTPISPMLDNIMTFWTCPQSIFTPGQALVMQGDYLKPKRDYIRSSYIPNTTQITQSPTLLSPANNAITSNQVTLDWEDTPNTTMYLLEISTYINFYIPSHTFLLSQSEHTVTLDANKKYYWRVTPYNEANTCSSTLISEHRSFTTGLVATNEIAAINNWTISPNPSSSTIQILLNSNKQLDVTIQVIDLNGRIVHQEERKVFAEQNQINLTNEKLKSGHFIVRLLSENTSELRQLIIE